MSILNKLASALDRKDEVPNQELAQEIAEKEDSAAIRELVDNLKNKKRPIQNDCIKVLYEIGERKPALIADYINEFLSLLTHKNNRLQWGAMTALNCIAKVKPEEIYNHLPEIMQATEKGSVITRDQAVNILISLADKAIYTDQALSLIFEQLRTCPVNQLPMYAERALPVIHDAHKADFVSVLTDRLAEVEKESKRKRIEKVLRKF